MHLFFYYFLTILVATASDKGSQQFSLDCRNWKSVGDSFALTKGYMKDEDSTVVYYDRAKKLQLILGDQPMALLIQNGHFYTFFEKGMNSAESNDKSDAFTQDLVAGLATLAKGLAVESAWQLQISDDGQDTLLAMVGHAKKCSAAPQMRAIVCRKGRPCLAVGPNTSKAEETARACASELGLLLPSKFKNITRACDLINDRKTYKSILDVISTARSACKTNSYLPSLERMKQACIFVQDRIKELQPSLK